MPISLFQKYGGFSSVSRIVLSFYDKVLDSDQIGDFFVDVDMNRLIDHQTKFIASILGGPVSYNDKRLAQVHLGMGISNSDFDEMVKLLRESLIESGFDPGDCRAATMAIESRRASIVADPT